MRDKQFKTCPECRGRLHTVTRHGRKITECVQCGEELSPVKKRYRDEAKFKEGLAYDQEDY